MVSGRSDSEVEYNDEYCLAPSQPETEKDNSAPQNSIGNPKIIHSSSTTLKLYCLSYVIGQPRLV